MNNKASSRILFVEDDPTIRRRTEVALEMAGYSVEAVETMAQALKHLKKRRPDLALLDVELPDGSGFEICRRIRDGEKTPIPVLFLSRLDSVRDRLEGFKAGGNDYIPKPFFLEELFARIGVHMRTKQLGDVMVKKNRALALRDRVRRDLTDMIVHDLKTPLTSIRGTLSMVTCMGLLKDDEAKKLVNMSEGAAEMMIFMINDLLDLSKAEDDRLHIKSEQVRLTEVFDRIQKLFEAQCGRYSVDLQVRKVPKTLRLQTDFMLVFRSLTNLVSNALKHTLRHSEKGREIVLEAVRGDGAVRLIVSDRGPGIPDAKKEAIFKKFVSLDEDPDFVERSDGIGLAFCRMAAETLGGRVWVEDREGGGSRFILEIPEKTA